jgi:protease PrsW
MLLLALALAPGIAIMIYFYSKDQYDREPLKNLIISFLLGILSTLPAIILQLTLSKQLDAYFASKSLVYYFIYTFGIIGLSEEGSKLFMLRIYAYRKKAFNEPLDGIIYSVMVSMGFATLENIGYVWEGGLSVAFLRMFLSVPAHASFAVLMGYHVGLAKFDPENANTHFIKGLLLAAFFHGSYDFFLFLQQSQEITKIVSGGLLLLGALISYWIAIRISLKSIKLHHNLSKMNFENSKNTVSG